MSYRSVCNEIKKKIMESIDQCKAAKHFYLFGLNQYSMFIINTLHQNGLEIQAVLDNNKAKQGGLIAGKNIVSPDSIAWEEDIIYVASQHEAAMVKQISQLTNNVAFVSLFDFVKYNRQEEHRAKFWEEDVFLENLQLLEDGEKVYSAVFNNKLLVISPTISIGDQFLWNIYFDQYLIELGMPSCRIVTASKSAAKVIKLFGREDLVTINEEAMNGLVSYVMYCGEKNCNSLLVYPRHEYIRKQDLLADWNGLAWQRIYAEYIFKLKTIKCRFPDLHSKEFNEENLKKMGLKKGRTVILSPYANTVNELSLIFWEKLAHRLISMGFSVVTNAVGEQKAILDTFPLNIPFDSCEDFLEYAGYFIAIRNGLCDIAGRAKCRKIVIFNGKRQLYTSEIHYNNLKVDGVSPDSIYITSACKDEETLVADVLGFL